MTLASIADRVSRLSRSDEALSVAAELRALHLRLDALLDKGRSNLIHKNELRDALGCGMPSAEPVCESCGNQLAHVAGDVTGTLCMNPGCDAYRPELFDDPPREDAPPSQPAHCVGGVTRPPWHHGAIYAR